MGYIKRHAIGLAAMMAASVLTCQGAIAGENTVSIDMTDYNDAAWDNIAMANDDTVETGVNIRSNAGDDAEIAGFLYRGGAVYVLHKGDEWTEVTSGSVTGFIKNEYLTFGTEAKGLAEHYGIYGVKTNWDDVNMFAENNGDASIVNSAKCGETFRLAGKSGSWMELNAGNGNLVYVPAEDVMPVIVLDGAVAKDEEKASSQAEQAFTEFAAVPVSASEEGSAEGSSYEAVYSEESCEEASSYETYEEADSYDGSYSENYDDSYNSSYDESYSASDNTVSESSYTAASAPSADYSYTATYDGSGSLQEQANALYDDYLSAQAKADAAVSDGADAETINATAAAAQSAYAAFVKMQNAADEASWNTPAAQSSTSTSASSEAAETYSDTTYTETTSTESYTQPQTTAAETTSQVSTSDVNLLAALIYCEAGNQPYEGQVAVGAVVMNRVASGSFPSTVSDVIYQGGQFTPAFSGGLANAIANGSGANYIGAASEAMAGSDPTGGALYFNTHQGTGKKIGAHWFF